MTPSETQDENFGKALDFIGPKVDRWIRELFKGFEVLKIREPRRT